MRIRKLNPEEHRRTKALYEEVFSEDSRAFVDYYYRVCASENRIYVWETEEREIVSMLHLNPYSLRMGPERGRIFYIVAVATRESYRGRGLMRGLLIRALGDMYEERLAFTFLMPAAEAIYTPYDFRFIYSQRQLTLQARGPGAFRNAQAGQKTENAGLGEKGVACRRAKKRDLPALSAFAETSLKEYATAALHTEAYFDRLLEEQECQGGEIMTLWKEERLEGYFFTAREPGQEIREAVASREYGAALLECMRDWSCQEEGTKIHGASWGLPQDPEGKEEQIPLIMARLVNLEALVSCLRAEGRALLYLCLEDPLLAENTGSFLLTIDREGGRLEAVRIVPEGTWTLTAAQFIQLVFGYKSPGELGAPGAFCQEWKSVKHLGPVFLNEVV